MNAMFSEFVGDCLEIFMDDFSIFGSSFDLCLSHLTCILQLCIQYNLVLSWEKSHFMVQEGISLGHKVTKKGLEVDKAKIEVIKGLPLPSNLKEVRSFLGHTGFYRSFIQNYAQISKPLTNLLSKDTELIVDELVKTNFNTLKEALIKAPILQPPNWTLTFEIYCDASEFSVGAVLG